MRQTTMLFILIAGALSLALFSVKYHVQDLEEELANLNRSIKIEHQAIRVLNAEWSHLNNPERLRGLAHRHLGLGSVMSTQMQTLESISKPKEVPTQ